MDEEKIKEAYYKFMSDISEIEESKAKCMKEKDNLEAERKISEFIYGQERERFLEFESMYGESEELISIKNDIANFYEEDKAELRKKESALEEEYRDLVQKEKTIEEEYEKLKYCEDTKDE